VFTAPPEIIPLFLTIYAQTNPGLLFLRLASGSSSSPLTFLFSPYSLSSLGRKDLAALLSPLDGEEILFNSVSWTLPVIVSPLSNRIGFSTSFSKV